MIANVRMTLILEQNFYSIVMQIILKTPTKLKLIGANDIKKHCRKGCYWLLLLQFDPAEGIKRYLHRSFTQL